MKVKGPRSIISSAAGGLWLTNPLFICHMKEKVPLTRSDSGVCMGYCFGFCPSVRPRYPGEELDHVPSLCLCV